MWPEIDVIMVVMHCMQGKNHVRHGFNVTVVVKTAACMGHCNERGQISMQLW